MFRFSFSLFFSLVGLGSGTAGTSTVPVHQHPAGWDRGGREAGRMREKERNEGEEKGREEGEIEQITIERCLFLRGG